jgi:hypothetical protein
MSSSAARWDWGRVIQVRLVVELLISAAEQAAATQDSLAERDELTHAVVLGGGQLAPERRARRRARLLAARGQARHVRFVAGVGEGAAQLGQERLEPDLQLQRRLARALGLEVGARAQQQALAGVEPFAPAEHGCDPLLRSQVLLAPALARGSGGVDVHRQGGGVLARRGLLAAAVAEPHGGGMLGRERLAEMVGGGDRPGVEGAVEQADALGEQPVGLLLGGERRPQPALGVLGVLEGGEGPDRGGPRQRQRRRLGTGLGRLRAAAPAARGGRRPERLQDEDALLRAGSPAREVAPVGQRQRPGEIELRESE